jgi:hypothetical protein
MGNGKHSRVRATSRLRKYILCVMIVSKVGFVRNKVSPIQERGVLRPCEDVLKFDEGHIQ